MSPVEYAVGSPVISRDGAGKTLDQPAVIGLGLGNYRLLGRQ